jgi:hypothetical protein
VIAELVNFFSGILFYLAGMFTTFISSKLFIFKEGAKSIYRSEVIFGLVNVVATAQT